MAPLELVTWKMLAPELEETGTSSLSACWTCVRVAKLAATMADAMLERGIYVIGFSYPVVPKGQARIRVQISAGHTPEHIDRAVAAFTEVGKALGVLHTAQS